MCQACEYLEAQVGDAEAAGDVERARKLKPELEQHEREHGDALEAFADEYGSHARRELAE